MSDLSRNEVKYLLEAGRGTCISLYLPTHRVTAHVEQDRIRLKNLLKQTESILDERGVPSTHAKQLLSPAHAHYNDDTFWRHRDEGLAMFLAEDFARDYSLPLSFREEAIVAEQFHLKPLLPLLVSDGPSFILAISQESVRLLACTRDHVEEVDLPGVPRSLDEALKYDQPEKQLQFHTRASERGGEREAMFHGHGQAKGEDAKNRLLRYFQHVDHGIRERLKDQRIPLILAAVEYYLPIYRQASSYAHILDEVIAGNPEGQRNEELHRLAWTVIEPQFRRDREQAEAQFRQGADSNRTSTDLKQVLIAAHEGRISSLFVTLDQEIWGSFDPNTLTMTTHEGQQPGDRDLLDLAAMLTVLKGGTVFAVEQSAVPGGTSVAAVHRYLNLTGGTPCQTIASMKPESEGAGTTAGACPARRQTSASVCG